MTNSLKRNQKKFEREFCHSMSTKWTFVKYNHQVYPIEPEEIEDTVTGRWSRGYFGYYFCNPHDASWFLLKCGGEIK